MFQKGNKYWQFNIGKKQSQETKDKISQSKKGIPLSKETRKKLSEIRKGKPSWRKGKIGITSEETRRKMSLARKGRSFHSEQQIEKLRLRNRTSNPAKRLDVRNKISQAMKGRFCRENHPNWKGGMTPLILQIRFCFKYRQWRSDIFTRDNWICQNCGKKDGGGFHAHHIKGLAKITHEYNIKTLEEALACEEIWDINNGTTLCIPCHKLTDNYFGKCQKKNK